MFDNGYITIDTKYQIDVSHRLHVDYGNGKDYYKYHGKRLMILPEQASQLPSKEYLQWHNENVFDKPYFKSCTEKLNKANHTIDISPLKE